VDYAGPCHRAALCADPLQKLENRVVCELLRKDMMNLEHVAPIFSLYFVFELFETNAL
jgi:hypothetical protein